MEQKLAGWAHHNPLLALLYLVTSKMITEITQNGLRSDKYFETSQLLTHPKGNNQIFEQTRKGLRANLLFPQFIPYTTYVKVTFKNNIQQ